MRTFNEPHKLTGALSTTGEEEKKYAQPNWDFNGTLLVTSAIQTR